MHTGSEQHKMSNLWQNMHFCVNWAAVIVKSLAQQKLVKKGKSKQQKQAEKCSFIPPAVTEVH